LKVISDKLLSRSADGGMFHAADSGSQNAKLMLGWSEMLVGRVGWAVGRKF